MHSQERALSKATNVKSQGNRIFIKKPFKENRAEKADKTLIKIKLDHALIRTRTRCTVLCVQVDGALAYAAQADKNKIHKTEPSEAGQHAYAHNTSNQSTKINS